MNKNNYKSLLEEYDFLSKSLNNIFKNVNTDIINSLFKSGIKTRNNKISFSDVLLYKFLYSYRDNTKQTIISNFNYESNTLIDRTTYHKKDILIKDDIYKSLFYKVRNLYYLNFKTDNFNLIAVDGTYNNTNVDNIKHKLETCLNMGYYNINECIPIDITFCNQENKNKEILQLKKYIKNDNFNDVNNIILVLDRAYYSYELINFLDLHNFNYVIRIKNNCSLIKNKELIKTKINKYQNIRIIKDTIDLIKKDDKNNNIKLKQTVECNIITNLDINKYNDEAIKKVYLSRWSIEVFFKLLKSNFKFSNLKEHNKKNTINEYNKLYYSILTIIYISHMVDKINDKYNYNIDIINNKNNKNNKNDKNNKNNKNDKKSKKNKYNIKTNKSLLISGIKIILKSIIKGILNKNDLLNISKTFLIKINIIKDVYNPRISKTPHSKWYIQSYAEYYRYLKIIKALKSNDLSSLNKNLKLLALNIKIIK